MKSVRKRPSKQRGEHGEIGASIIRGMREAIAFAKGEDVHAKVHRINVPVVDPRQIRQSMNLSQADFALKYGFSVATVRNWEQGRRAPELPAKILLAVIAKHPEAVEDVLGG
jgi:putative transcriptional regulator